MWGEGGGLTLGVGKVALSWGLGSCGSESQFRDGGVEEGPEAGCQEPQAGELSWSERCVLCMFDSVRKCFCTNHKATLKKYGMYSRWVWGH